MRAGVGRPPRRPDMTVESVWVTQGGWGERRNVRVTWAAELMGLGLG